MDILPLILIPFVGTALGAATVFLTRDKVSSRVQNALLGFAAGVMVAAAIWSLITPAIELSLHLGNMKWMPPAVGILLGMLFLLMLDSLVPHMHPTGDSVEGPQSKLGRRPMLMLAVTLHNIPEGMAVGAVIAGAMQGNSGIAPGDRVVLLDEGGKEFSSTEFASWIEHKQNISTKRLLFIVGGPYGFAQKVYDAAHEKLSLSKMTFSHQMIRLLFIEQLYRAYTIINHLPYHHN